MELLLWIENTGIAQWVTGSNSILAYPTILFLHTLGLSAVIGLSVFINLRVLGFARGLPFTVLKPFITLIWIAFGLAAVSGTLLLMSTASAKAQSPIFIAKLVFVGFAVVTQHLTTKRSIRTPQADVSPLPRQAHVLALCSLFLWVAATTAGRLIAYLG
jgi:hypothetical protein